MIASSLFSTSHEKQNELELNCINIMKLLYKRLNDGALCKYYHEKVFSLLLCFLHYCILLVTEMN